MLLRKGLSGNDLDSDLINVAQAAKNNRFDYDLQMITNGKPDKHMPVFVVPNDMIEYHDIKNQTKTQIQDVIVTTVCQNLRTTFWGKVGIC